VDRRLFYFNVFSFIILAILPLASLWMLQEMVDKVLEYRSITHRSVLTFLFLLVAVQILQSFVQHWTQYFQQKQQQQLSEHITLRVLTKAGRIPYSYYENPEYYDSLHMAQQQSAYLPSLVIQQVQSILQQVISVLALTVFLVTLHWSIPVFLILLSLPLAVSRLVYGQKQFQLEKQILPEQRKAHDFFQYLTSNTYAKEIRVFGLGDYFTDRYHHLMQSIFRQRDRLHFIHMRKGMMASVFEVVFIAVFYLLLISRAISGVISIGGLIVYVQAFQRLQLAIQTIFKSGVAIFQHQLYLQEIIHYLSLPASKESEPAGIDTFSNAYDSIRIRNLTFRYPGTERDVLRDISMEFGRGKVIAVVGENGSGKSTLMKLLCGLYRADEGRIFFGDMDSHELPPGFFQRDISVVFQDYCRYHLSLGENIALGKNEIDRDKIHETLDASTGSELLSGTGLSLDTGLGRNYQLGEEISGGQWQKIAISRALYRTHEVLILDEPTSAIDAGAESFIFQNLRRNVGNRIIILITHRLYNLKLADHIYVMKDYRLVENGSFDELTQRKGLFWEYYNAQKI
jgi:ATP-binding cassette subfamily B protein